MDGQVLCDTRFCIYSVWSAEGDICLIITWEVTQSLARYMSIQKEVKLAQLFVSVYEKKAIS